MEMRYEVSLLTPLVTFPPGKKSATGVPTEKRLGGTKDGINVLQKRKKFC